MKRVETIKKQEIFSDIIKNGRFKKNDCFILYSQTKTEENPNFGLAISNKVGKAHIRNKLKRRTRVLLDKYKNLFKKQHNYIIMIRKAAAEVKFEELEQKFKGLL